jgi:hypothetical protein
MKVYIILFVFCVGGTEANCGVGYILDESKTMCVECPANHKCDGIQEYPERCEMGKMSFPGSFQCCLKNATCPPGYAVNPSNDCECALIQCPTSKGHMLVKGNDIVCSSTSKCQRKCENDKWVQNENTCICYENKKCRKSSQSYWIDALRFVFNCVSNE